MNMQSYILDAVRSPIGRRNGTLSVLRGDDLAAQVLNGLVGRHDLDPAESCAGRFEQLVLARR